MSRSKHLVSRQAAKINFSFFAQIFLKRVAWTDFPNYNQSHSVNSMQRCVRLARR